jgi:hypothetical protein
MHESRPLGSGHFENHNGEFARKRALDRVRRRMVALRRVSLKTARLSRTLWKGKHRDLRQDLTFVERALLACRWVEPGVCTYTCAKWIFGV